MYASHVDRLVAFGEPYLARSSERQLLMYSMDKSVNFSILLLNLIGLSKGLQRDAKLYFRLPHRLPTVQTSGKVNVSRELPVGVPHPARSRVAS